MNYSSEIKNLTDLVLASGHVKLVTDLLGHIHEVYAWETDSFSVLQDLPLIGKSLTDCSNLELVKKVTETIEIVHQKNTPSIQIISFSSKEAKIQFEMEIFPIPNQKFLITLKHQLSAKEETNLDGINIDLPDQIVLENSDYNNAYESLDLKVLTNSNKEIKTETESEKHSNDLDRSLISGIGEEISSDPEVSLRTPEDQFLKIVTRVPLPIFLVDELSLEIFFTNPSILEYFEYEDDELIKLNLFDLFPSSENHYLSSVIRKGGVISLEADYSWRLITKMGNEKTARFLINQIDYQGRKTLMMIIIDQEDDSVLNFIREDTNNLSFAEKDLLVVRMTPDGIITKVNKNFAELIGRPLRKVINRSFEENLFVEDYEGIFQHFAKLTPQNPTRKNVNRMLTAEGKTVWIEWSDRGIFKGDKLVEIYGSGKNITDTYQRDLLHQSMEQRFQALVENLPMVTYVIHAQTMYPLYISPQVETFTGYTQEEFYRNPEVWLNAMHPDDAEIFYSKLQQRIEKKITGPVTFRMYHKNGSLRWAEEIGSTITLPDGTLLFQGISRDISDHQTDREKLVYYSNFERLVNEISLKLMNANPENLSEVLQNTVETLGEYMQVDRSYLFDFHEEKQTLSNTFEWCNKGVSSQIGNLQNLPFSLFSWWMEKMKNNQEISLETMDEIPPEALHLKEHLISQEILSLLVVPMFNNGKASGLIGFDMVTKTISWEKEAIQLLRLVSAMITSTKERLEDLL